MMSDLDAFDALAAGKSITDDANYSWRVARHPVGNVTPSDFRWDVSQIPEPAPGEVLLKAHYLGLAPVMRMYMMGGSPSGEMPLRIGDVIHGRGVAQVIKSRHPDYRKRCWLRCRWHRRRPGEMRIPARSRLLGNDRLQE